MFPGETEGHRHGSPVPGHPVKKFAKDCAFIVGGLVPDKTRTNSPRKFDHLQAPSFLSLKAFESGSKA